MCVCACVPLCPVFATPQTITHQAPLPMEFSKQECWSGLPFPSPGDRPNRGIQPTSPALAGGILYRYTTWEALIMLMAEDEPPQIEQVNLPGVNLKVWRLPWGFSG